MKKSFVEKLNGEKPLIGTIITFDSTESAEIISNCGFDWLFVDMEHAPLSLSSVQHIIQATQTKCSVIIRTPENNSTWIKRVLDTGCDGVLIPQVKTPDEARQAVAAARYPPLGTRSIGVARAQGYGARLNEYVTAANNRIALIIQIEHIDAVNNLDEILTVEGIDAIFIGPYDLSGSMGLLGDVISSPVQEAIKEIKVKCKTKNIPTGIFVVGADAAKTEIEDNCRLIAVGIDSMLLWGAAKESLSRVTSFLLG